MDGNIPTTGTFLIATALAMDAFAASLACGPSTRNEPILRISRMPLMFGLFQAGMLAGGWFAVEGFREAVEAFDHWVAFALLLAVGMHMVGSGVMGDGKQRSDPLRLPVLLVLALATSVDAFAVGMGLSIVQAPILTPAAVTGAVTFALSAAAVYIGNRGSFFLGRSAEVLGGLLLIAIGVKILINHIG